MSIDHNDVVKTLRSPMSGAVGVDPDLIVWENVARSPPDPDAIYIDEVLIPFDSSPIGSGYDRLVGEYRLNVSAPRGSGTEGARSLAKILHSLYPNGSSVVDALTVVVDNSELLSAHLSQDENRYVIPLAVTFRVEAIR